MIGNKTRREYRHLSPRKDPNCTFQPRLSKASVKMQREAAGGVPRHITLYNKSRAMRKLKEAKVRRWRVTRAGVGGRRVSTCVV